MASQSFRPDGAPPAQPQRPQHLQQPYHHRGMIRSDSESTIAVNQSSPPSRSGSSSSLNYKSTTAKQPSSPLSSSLPSTANSSKENLQLSLQTTLENSRSRSGSPNPPYSTLNPDPNCPLNQSSPNTNGDDKPYHVFSPLRKRMLVYLVSLAALFSPLSSNIYFPALPTIATQLHVSPTLITLSVTTYMIVQGLAPSFWGFLADGIGRRPVFVGTFLVYIAANIALAQTNSFAMLLFWRAVQAAGSSATISIGAGVIGDIASPCERAGFVGTFGGLRMMGQSIGPVLGGVLSQFLGYKSIFYFLTILSSITLLLILFLLPETLRCIAGDGSVEVSGWTYTPWFKIFQSRRGSSSSKTDREKADVGKEMKKNTTKRPKLEWFTIIEPLRFLFEKDVFVSLLFGSIVYTIWSMVTASTGSTFKDRYGYDDLVIGLCFLPNGIGCVLGSSITGKLMDRDFRQSQKRYTASLTEKGLPAPTLKKGCLPDDFPVERARLANTWWLSVVFFVSVTLYGWSLRLDVVSPLLLQFLIAYSATAVFSINSTLVIDLYPGKSASATAVNNLARCSVGAIGVAFVEKMIEALGDTGYCFTILAGVFLVSTPLVFVEMRWGGKWRVARNERLRAKAAAAASTVSS